MWLPGPFINLSPYPGLQLGAATMDALHAVSMQLGSHSLSGMPPKFSPTWVGDCCVELSTLGPRGEETPELQFLSGSSAVTGDIQKVLPLPLIKIPYQTL